MSRSSSSAPPPADAELLLPRAPGVIRQFWARHPRLTDVLIAVICFFMTAANAGTTVNATGRLAVEAGEFDNGAPASVPVVVAITLMSAGACVSLLWRRRIPELPAVLAVVVQTALMFLPGGSVTPVIVVALYSLAVYRSSRACWIALGGTVAIVGTAAWLSSLAAVETFYTPVNATLEVSVTALIGALIGVNVGNRKRYLEAVIDRSRQLLVERDQQGRLAAAAERARIAREMHDIVSHNLTVMVALAEGATATNDRERAHAATAQIAETGRSALTQMRAMLGVLRDDDGAAPLAPVGEETIGDAVRAAQNAGYPVTLTTTGNAELSPSVLLAATRAVQEGLTNAMRHSRATRIDVGIAYTDKTIDITIRNDGAGAARQDGGFGIRGLQERVTHVGGTLTSGPGPAGTWELRASLPRRGDTA